jgi:hypothetical protein
MPKWQGFKRQSIKARGENRTPDLWRQKPCQKRGSSTILVQQFAFDGAVICGAAVWFFVSFY